MSSAAFGMRRPVLVGMTVCVVAMMGYGAWRLRVHAPHSNAMAGSERPLRHGERVREPSHERDSSGWASLPISTRLGIERAMADANDTFAPTRIPGGYALSPTGGAAVRLDATGASLLVGTHEARFTARSIGRSGREAAFRSGTPAVVGREVHLDRGAGVTEWWRSLARGIEHGVTLAARPEGEGELAIELEVDGDLSPRLRGDEVVLVDGSERVVARYAELAVSDSRGHALTSRFEVAGDRVRIHFDDIGAEYPVVVDPMVFGEEQILLATDGVVYDAFGASVAMSADGTRVVVGAPTQDDADAATSDNGAAYVFVRSGFVWTQEQKLLASDKAESDYFGSSVSMSPDGSRLVVGSPADDDATGTSTVNNGAAYVFVRSGSTWTEEQKLVALDKGSSDAFGTSVSMSADGTRVVAGAYWNDDATGTSTMDSGAAYVFVRSLASWTQEQKLLASDKADNDSFGWSVAMSGDGTRLVIGAYLEDDATGTSTVNSGAVYVFARSGSVWSQEQKLLASDKASSDRFGQSVSMSLDGTRLVVGADSEDDATGTSTTNNGAAYVFARAGSLWTQEQKLIATDKAIDDEFGTSVSMSSDGMRLLVGSLNADHAARFTDDSGAAYVFVRAGTAWSQAQKVLPAVEANAARFGNSVALSGDGTRLVVGKANFVTGAAHTFGFGTPGAACSIAGDCLNGFCVDGFCCDGACGGGATDDCVACSGTFTNVRDGICAPIAPFAPSVTCRASAGDCDSAETCIAGNPTCPADTLVSPSTVCRASVDVTCDVTEYCTGASATCPTDVVVAAGTECRAAAGTCDVAESCTGGSPTCPADAFVSNVTVCRTAVAGGCDVAESCTGSTAACPTDVHVAGGTTCRLAAGACDLAEECDGSAACPTDIFVGSGTACRASTGMCDVEESCTGSVAACPVNAFVADGATCDDGLACSATSACQLGACAAALTVDCSDGNSCTTDSCAEPSGCMHTLIASCMTVDAGTMADASTNDAGGTTTPEPGGCSCRVGGRSTNSQSNMGLVLASAVALLAASKMRKRRRNCSGRGPRPRDTTLAATARE